MSTEISLTARVVNVEEIIGSTGLRWLKFHVVATDGHLTEISVFGGYDLKKGEDYHPELVVEDNVSVRRVQTIHDEEAEDVE